MDKVYIVTSGFYSDYCIEGVFSTEERAMSFIRATGLERNASSRWWSVDASLGKAEQGYNHYVVQIRENGDIVKVAKDSFTNLGERGEWIFRYTEGKQIYQTFMWATDKTHAIKIANERRIRILALNLWNKGKVEGI